jgi:hypothetical protein
MKYIKYFKESFETPFEEYANYFVDFLDDSKRYEIKFSEYEIFIKINYSKRELFYNRSRRIIGYFDKESVRFENDKIGPIYRVSKKSKDTLYITDKLEDSLLKLANFSRHNVGYVKIGTDVIRIILGQKNLDNYLKY